MKLAERAVQPTCIREPAVLEVLAAAYAESGIFSAALETARRAQTLAAQQSIRELAAALSVRIGLYQGRIKSAVLRIASTYRS